MSNKIYNHFIKDGLEGGMFSPSPRASSIRDKLLPKDLKENLFQQWNTAALGSSNVHIRYVDRNSGNDWFITGWNGHDTLAGYTKDGFRNIAITEIINNGATIDETWDTDTTLNDVKSLRPLSEMKEEKVFKGFNDKSHELFTKVTNSCLSENDNNDDHQFEDNEYALIVEYSPAYWISDMAKAVNMMDNRDCQVYERSRGVTESFVFSYDSGEWDVDYIEPNDLIYENEFVLECVDESPMFSRILESLEILPKPLIEGVAHYKDELHEQTWVVATGSSLMESGTTAYLAEEGVPHGMMPLARVSAYSKDDAISKVMDSIDSAKESSDSFADKDNEVSPFLRSAAGFKMIDLDT